MSVITTVSIPAEDFTLGVPISANPGIKVRLQRVIPVCDTFIPYLWVSDEDIRTIRSALHNERDIEGFTILDTLDDEALVRVDWNEQLDGFLVALTESRATMLEGIGEAGSWRFQLRFDDHDQLTEFYRHCTDHGIQVDIENVQNPRVPNKSGSKFDLTDTQREALHYAFEQGYFAVPRETKLVELAEQLGISDSAVSQRLRRGIDKILTTTRLESDLGERDWG